MSRTVEEFVELVRSLSDKRQPDSVRSVYPHDDGRTEYDAVEVYSRALKGNRRETSILFPGIRFREMPEAELKHHLVQLRWSAEEER